MADSILPHNSSALERDIEELGGKKRIDGIENPVGTMWNPQAVPAKILPYLAWALSVDKWEDDWSDDIKRNVIAASVEVHRKKGTVGAVKKAIAATGIDVEFLEWFENGGTPHTFSITAWSNENINNDGTTRLLPKAYADTIEGVNATKPVRAHFELMFGSRIPSDVGMALDGNVTSRAENTTEIVPYPSRSNTLAGSKYDAIAPGRSSETQEILPYPNRSNSEAGGKYEPLVSSRAASDMEIIPYAGKASSSAGGKYDPIVAARIDFEQEITPYLNQSNSEIGGGYDPYITARASESVEITPYTNVTGSDFGMSGTFAENSRINLNLEII